MCNKFLEEVKQYFYTLNKILEEEATPPVTKVVAYE